MLTVQGGQFENVTVNVGGQPCAVDKSQSNLTQLVCLLPEGSGAKHDLVIAHDETLTATPLTVRAPGIFSYNQPKIKTITGCGSIEGMPDSCATRGGSVLTITGEDFGNKLSEISVVVGGSKPCTELALVTPHEQLTCKLPAGVGTWSNSQRFFVTVRSCDWLFQLHRI